MFAGVDKKLERVEYFLKNLKALADEAGGFAYIKKQPEMRASLDAFFFEIISAKDFFLQGINDSYGLGLKKNQATDTARLIPELRKRNLDIALNVVTSMENLLNDHDSWLWRLNNYRNSATHRELLHLGHKVKFTMPKDLFDKIQQGKLVIKPIYEGEKIEIPPEVRRVDIPRENIKTYLFKDPEDPSKGNVDIEVIPYCEQSLTKMRELLEGLYSEMGLE